MRQPIGHNGGPTAAPCATNYVSDDGSLRSAHVGDDLNDLMYSGDQFGVPIELDQGHDDYFDHEIRGGSTRLIVRILSLGVNLADQTS